MNKFENILFRSVRLVVLKKKIKMQRRAHNSTNN